MSADRWMRVNPVVFQARGIPAKSDRAFVIMPFTPRWSKCVFRTVKKALEEAGITCTRADEQYGHQILQDIWTGLCEASIVVADVTGRNPNVYYELGVAHVLGRRVILITQDAGDIPFDTRVYRHILYRYSFRASKNSKHMGELAKTIKGTVEWIQENETLPLQEPIVAAYDVLRRGTMASESLLKERREIADSDRSTTYI